MEVQDYDGDRIAIFEVKYSRRLEDLPYDCERAIKQIDVRRYGEEFAEDYSTVICYGIAFYRKRCMVKVKLPLSDHPAPNHNPRIPGRLAGKSSSPLWRTTDRPMISFTVKRLS